MRAAEQLTEGEMVSILFEKGSVRAQVTNASPNFEKISFKKKGIYVRRALLHGIPKISDYYLLVTKGVS